MALVGLGLGKSHIPFDMFDLQRNADEARRLHKLGNLYHRGQELAWDGRAVLKDLIAKHGGINLPPEKRDAMAKIFGVIMWGELAAWKISAELADQLVPLEAKMAATSQAHDEARHFYVMYDYLSELGNVPTTMDKASRVLLDMVIETRSLANKLLGMQLMVETLALTIFQAVREANAEPVLSELLRYYEKDEARHVGLGVQTLPQMIGKMGAREGISLFAFQVQIIGWSIMSLKSLEPAFAELGLDARTILELGRAKQVIAFNQLWDQMGIHTMPKSREYVFRVVNSVCEVIFPRAQPVKGILGVARALRTGWKNALDDNLVPTTLDPTETPRKVVVLH
jgi:hypothetical protein